MDMNDHIKKIDNFLKKLDTPEGKSILNSYIPEFIKKREKMRILASNYEYINWLKNFIEENNLFYNDDWLYFPKEISETDNNNINDLNIFYEVVDEYAIKNHIYPTSYDYEAFYKVRMDETGFEIGYIGGQGTSFFCKRIPIKDKKEFIDFKDILNNEKQKNVDKINDSLDEISNLINLKYEEGIPIEAITDTVNNTINKLKNNRKILIKK